VISVYFRVFRVSVFAYVLSASTSILGAAAWVDGGHFRVFDRFIFGRGNVRNIWPDTRVDRRGDRSVSTCAAEFHYPQVRPFCGLCSVVAAVVAGFSWRKATSMAVELGGRGVAFIIGLGSAGRISPVVYTNENRIALGLYDRCFGEFCGAFVRVDQRSLSACSTSRDCTGDVTMRWPL
jgi:hypothetical protein